MYHFVTVVGCFFWSCKKATREATQRGYILVHFGTPVWAKKMPKTLVLSILVHFGTLGMRRERDSNPRYSFPYTHFPGVLLQPLGHLSLGVVGGKYTQKQSLNKCLQNPDLSDL